MPGKKPRLGRPQHHARHVERRLVEDEHRRHRHEAPDDHDARHPEPRSHLVENQVAGNLEQAVAEEEQASPDPVGGVAQVQVALKLPRGESDVHAVDVGDDVADECEGDDAAGHLRERHTADVVHSGDANTQLRDGQRPASRISTASARRVPGSCAIASAERRKFNAARYPGPWPEVRQNPPLSWVGAAAGAPLVPAEEVRPARSDRHLVPRDCRATYSGTIARASAGGGHCSGWPDASVSCRATRDERRDARRERADGRRSTRQAASVPRSTAAAAEAGRAAQVIGGCPPARPSTHEGSGLAVSRHRPRPAHLQSGLVPSGRGAGAAALCDIRTLVAWKEGQGDVRRLPDSDVTDRRPVVLDRRRGRRHGSAYYAAGVRPSPPASPTSHRAWRAELHDLASSGDAGIGRLMSTSSCRSTPSDGRPPRV